MLFIRRSELPGPNSTENKTRGTPIASVFYRRVQLVYVPLEARLSVKRPLAK